MNDFKVKILSKDRGKSKRRRTKGAFRKRQQARQWCRNHWYDTSHNGMEIVHPDGRVETFNWNGML